MNFQFGDHNWKLYPAKVAREKLIQLKNTGTVVSPRKSASISSESLIRQIPELINRCTKCANFCYSTTEEFREHCRTEWHIYNLKLPFSPLSFEDWSSRLSDSDDESVESSESEEVLSDDLPIFYGTRWKLTEFECIPIALANVIPNPTVLWASKYVSVLLLRSGRFAGAVWDSKGNVLVHTCFKRYTVRRKNGGAQSKHDTSRGSLAHSVGAQIRRSQERKLDEEVGELIERTWKKYFVKDSIVFAYACKSLTESLYVGPLERSNRTCTVFPVPLSVSNPTFAEVVRVHKILTLIGI